MRERAEQIVDALIEGWFRDRWNDVKSATGIGHDNDGLGKNTEKGWKPRYNGNLPDRRPPVRRRPPPPSGPGEKTWNLG